ncbi:hypothetical protein TNCV_342741 [Trichonephila clavipes]|nr:hypothetical protein TNCV_342741 [Trichonephila clavipes]
MLTINERNLLSVTSFMHNVAPPYYANAAKQFVLTTFSVNRVIGRGCKVAWTPRSTTFRLLVVRLFGITCVSFILFNTSRTQVLSEVFRIHSYTLHSASMVIVSIFRVGQCPGGHVEQLLLQE